MKHKLASTLYVLTALVTMGIGIRYVFASSIMPYHIEAMGAETWMDLTNGQQTMTLGFMKSAAAGFIASAISVLFLVAIPFRKKEGWSNIAIVLIILSNLGIVMSQIINISINTSARPPVVPFLIMSGLTVIGGALGHFAIVDHHNKGLKEVQ